MGCQCLNKKQEEEEIKHEENEVANKSKNTKILIPSIKT